MELFLSEDKTNLGRQHKIDYAKVIAIVFIVLIHVWEELSYFERSLFSSSLVDLLTPRSLIKANANTNINNTTLIVTIKIF